MVGVGGWGGQEEIRSVGQRKRGRGGGGGGGRVDVSIM